MPNLNKYRAFIACFLFINTFLFCQEFQQNVRVGFFKYDNYNLIDNNGRKSGYGYDFLQHMRTYSNLNYSYEMYNKSFYQLLPYLERGDIDLIPFAPKTPELEQLFDFSKYSIGRYSTIFSVKAGTTKYLPGDFEKYNNIRVGMIKDTVNCISFAKYAKEHNFTYIPVYYDDISSLQDALQDESIVDAIITSNFRKLDNEWILDQFDYNPFYLMVRKGDYALLNKINACLEKLSSFNPGLETILNSRYSELSDYRDIKFDASERIFIDEIRLRGKVFKISSFNTELPFIGTYNDEPVGIFHKIIQYLEELTGFQFQYVPFDPNDTSISLIIDFNNDSYKAESYGYKLTEKYIDLSISEVYLQNYKNKKNTVAIPKGLMELYDLASDIFNPQNIFVYNTAEDCIKAVKQGKQDSALLPSLQADYYTSNDFTGRLISNTIYNGDSLSYSIGIKSDSNSLFTSIINKCVLNLSATEVYAIISNEMKYFQKDKGIISLFMRTPILLLFLIIIISLTIFVFAIHIKTKQQLNFIKNQEQKSLKILNSLFVNRSFFGEIDFFQKKLFIIDFTKSLNRIESKNYYGIDQIEDFIYREDIPLIQDIQKNYIENTSLEAKGPKELICRIKNQEGKYRWTFVTISKAEDKPNSIYFFMRDINETKTRDEISRSKMSQQIADLAEKASQLEAFLLYIVHELKLPVNLLIDYSSDPKIKAAEVANNYSKSFLAIDYIIHVINDILSQESKHEVYAISSKVNFSIKKILNDALDLLNYQIEQKKLKVEVISDTVVEDMLFGQSIRLYQAFLNIISNSIKYTPPNGKIKIEIIQISSDDKNVNFQIIITDTGIGFEDAVKDLIYESFEEIPSHLKHKNLGFAIIKKVANLMNGDLQIESDPNKGTCVSFSAVFEKQQTININDDNLPELSTMNVLVINDSDTKNEISNILQQKNIQCQTIPFADDFIASMIEKQQNTTPFGVCIFDTNINNFKLIESIRILRDKSKSMPIIIVTDEKNIKELGFIVSFFNISAILPRAKYQNYIFDEILKIRYSALGMQYLF